MSESRAELAVDLLKAYSTWIGLGIFAVFVSLAAAVAAGVDFPTIVIPRPHKVFLIAAVAGAFVAAAPATKILRWLFDPPRRYLVQPALSEDDGGIWELSPAQFEDLHVSGGQLYEWPGTEWPVYEVQSYDPETNMAVGTWRGSASDGEMIRTETKIDEVRGHLEDKAQERDILITRAETIVREAVMNNARMLVAEYNRASLIDPSAVAEGISDVLEDANLTEDLRETDEQQTDPDEAPADPDATATQPTRAAADGGTTNE